MFDWLFELPQTSPVAHALALIVLVCAAGMAAGSVRFKGIGLGSSGVLFMGILVGQLGEPIDRQILNFIREFGLILFVFALGLQLGPGFFASLRSTGLRLNLLAAALVLLAGVLAPLLGWLIGLDPAAMGGLFAGASVNIPALGAAQQSLASLPGISSDRQSLPALACAVCYPAAIVGSLVTLLLLKLFFRIDPIKEAEAYAAEQRRSIEPLMRRTLVVENPQLNNSPIDDVCRLISPALVVSRIRRAGQTEVEAALRGARVSMGDAILAVGSERLLDRLECEVGRRSEEDLLATPSRITFRRIVVTNAAALGKTADELAFETRLGVEVTRITRGDIEMTAVPGLRLQFGDVLQIVGSDDQLQNAANLLGNSLKRLNETQFIPLFAGIFFGIVVGSLPLRIPGLANPLRLGLAGGPLIVALALGRIGHIGRFVWYMPQSTNHAFREFGIALFFAALGLAAGDQFFAAVLSRQGAIWLLTGTIVTMFPLLAVGIWARAALKLNFVTLGGLLAGGTTNPPALTFVTNLCESDAPALAYAAVYPLTTVLRIVVAQMVVLLLCG